MGSSSQNTPPAAPDIQQSYQAGADVYLRNLPAFLNQEAMNRWIQDPTRVRQQQSLQSTYGPTQYAQQLAALHQFDPQSFAVRNALAKNVQSDLASGYSLPKAYDQELTSQIRGAQSARGNILGPGEGSAEAVYKGKAALDLYQQHLDNAGQFLHAPTPEQQSLAISGVTPDRTSAYANPSAGYQGQQFALNNYQNLLAQYQLQGQGGGNVWQRALRGASIGASQGSAGGLWGAAGGAAGGAIDGAFNGPIYQQQTTGSWSDARLKTDIHEIAKAKSGIQIVSFKYLGSNRKFVGALAQDVAKVCPDAVQTAQNGFMKVNYGMIDVPFFELKGVN